jgi:UDP:flavonoid glycosyltransferase YjiC (YdhE family)
MGLQMVDIFGPYPVAAVDNVSFPPACRLVTHAASCAEEIADQVSALAPDVIVNEPFGVVGNVVARQLELPFASVIANSFLVPSSVALLWRERNPQLSDGCLAAVETLQSQFGIVNAGPFLWSDCVSPHLNFFAQPEQFLTDGMRAELDPVVPFGCLVPELRPRARGPVFPPRRGNGRLFVAFGTFIWMLYKPQAEAALVTLAAAGQSLGLDVVIALGGAQIDDEIRRAIGDCDSVTLVDFVDQWTALEESDVFVTHNGANSTAEAVFLGVPMLSYPFFGDQLTTAQRAQELGLAVPVTDEPLGELSVELIAAALAQIAADRDGLGQRLAVARESELATIAGRTSAIDRLAEVAARG